MNVAAILLGLAGAVLFAFGSAMQQYAAKRERPRRAMDPRLLFQLLRQPRWLFGWIPDVAGTVLQAIALHLGALALVEPLLLAGVFLAVPLEATLNRRRPHSRDLVVVALSAVGLTAFLVAADPRDGVDEPTNSAWLGVGTGVAAALVVLLLIAWRTRGSCQGILLGIGTGLLYAFAASLLKTVTVQFAQGLPTLFANWQLYAMIVAGICGMVLNQNAYQDGPIAAPLTTIALVDPLASIGIGITAYREHLSIDAPRLAIEIAAALLMLYVLSLAATARDR